MTGGAPGEGRAELYVVSCRKPDPQAGPVRSHRLEHLNTPKRTSTSTFSAAATGARRTTRRPTSRSRMGTARPKWSSGSRSTAPPATWRCSPPFSRTAPSGSARMVVARHRVTGGQSDRGLPGQVEEARAELLAAGEGCRGGRRDRGNRDHGVAHATAGVAGGVRSRRRRARGVRPRVGEGAGDTAAAGWRTPVRSARPALGPSGRPPAPP